jgi:3-oxoacyl-(acyl-carrier-protein) synthase
MLSPLGTDVPSTWQGILAGRSGIGLIEHTDLSAYSTRFGGSVKGFNVEEYLSVKEARKLDLFIQYGLAAGFQAVRNAGLEVTDANRERIGVAMGSGIGGLTNIEETSRTLHDSGPRRISPFFVPGSIINMISGFLSIHLGAQGPNYAIATACTTGTHCIGMAARNIAYDEADVMIAGGAEMAACGLGMGGFGASRALSTRNDEPTRASRPWDKGRDGFVLSDGAGALVLEELEHAKARGATIYAELIGFGMSGDAYHMTSPPADGAGAARCITNALRDARINRPGAVHQRPRHLDPCRRPGRSQCDQVGVRRARLQAGGQLDQVHDRPPAGCGGRGRGDLQRAGDQQPGGATDHQPRRAGRRLRSRFRAAHGAHGRSMSCCPTRSGLAAPTARWCSAGSPADAQLGRRSAG